MSTPGAASGAIKTMQLYSNIDRIWNELSELGFSANGTESIDVATINKFDCYNYGGAVGATASCVPLALNKSSKVLDIGSGLGGPARCVANHSGCSIKGVELQPDLTELANTLTRRCGMADRVHFACGNILDTDSDLGDANSYDAAMSWLVILPLSARQAAFTRAFDLLKPGGRMYIEDFFLLSGGAGGSQGDNGFTPTEMELLRDEVYVPDGDLPSREAYTDTLRSVGFEVDFQDVTAEWTSFTAGRHEAWRNERARHERVHNAETWNALDRFYSAIVTLFGGGNLGGVRLILTKPT